MRFSLLVLLLFTLLPPAALRAQSVPADTSGDYSGMYSFLRDGEFVQITVEDKGRVTGFISRFGDSESDKGVFINHFFKSGKLEGAKISFTTEGVHGVWFEFSGTAARGPGKKPDEEAYYLLRGNLTRFATDADKETTLQLRRVELKSFPRDTSTN